MSDLEKLDVECTLYRLAEKGETVSTAKSQFAEENDVEYSNVKGKVLFNRRTGFGYYPKFAVVSEIPE